MTEQSPQALPGDGVDWTEADYHATIGQLYAHISMQQKQINVLIQVRNELMEKINSDKQTTTVPADAVAHYETAIAMKDGEIDRLRALLEENLNLVEPLTPEYLHASPSTADSAMAPRPFPTFPPEKQP